MQDRELIDYEIVDSTPVLKVRILEIITDFN